MILLKNITVEKRAVFEFGKRKRFAYDATCNGHRVTAASRKEAIAEIKRDLSYIATARSLERNGSKLFAHGFEAWVFQHPNGGSFCFRAPNFDAAYAEVARHYTTEGSSQAFFRE